MFIVVGEFSLAERNDVFVQSYLGSSRRNLQLSALVLLCSG
jgi:hypothetical protein